MHKTFLTCKILISSNQDPDKVSKPGSQVRFIGLVLLPLFEALGELLPELVDFIVIPVRVALDFYK